MSNSAAPVDTARLYAFLTALDRDYDSRQRGKILQRLLQLAFHRAGYRLVEERISEGIDFDVAHRTDPARRFSFEARTTETFTVPVKAEDLRQMDARESEGYRSGIAALRIAPGAQWVFVARPWLRPGQLRVSVGNTAALAGLAAEINTCFGETVSAHAALALAGGLEALQPLLQGGSRP